MYFDISDEGAALDLGARLHGCVTTAALRARVAEALRDYAADSERGAITFLTLTTALHQESIETSEGDPWASALLSLLDVASRHLVAAQGRAKAVGRLSSELDVEREHAAIETGED
ncbi:hypothetical protein B1T45_00575 [Mycobacterium kansasii]|uniref:Uncharacterized protein n=1 Tax=Mycobacterium kansasii TaxID=1768 RepID=A0A653F6Z4_MYCKA|nr:hypothetical protein B1T43_00550 [Mycobacterium kansasii]ARG60052.1 hypothetical protein B1T45_00575 [Mycobacterium kansasii]ARG77698.1 hypothetical protein B1T51_28155 [Mycobacterium kansasii]ARG83186.1 hypothetical protein B1T52_28265 [Mycobacterium kansasii]ARG95276.1 hypothetical protein B1T50_28745 [Mycobacterium kansasii]